jgi:hypothetical protein
VTVTVAVTVTVTVAVTVMVTVGGDGNGDGPSLEPTGTSRQLRDGTIGPSRYQGLEDPHTYAGARVALDAAMRSLPVLAVLSLVPGCGLRGGSGADPDSPSTAVDSESATEAEGNLMMANVDGADMSNTAFVAGATPAALTVAGVTAAIQANAMARWNPSGCATVTVNGADVTIALADCTGPHGLVHVTGTLDLVVSITAASQVSVVASATGLEVNRADLDVNATAVYSVTPTEHVLTVQSTGTGTGPLGTNIDHEGHYTLSWDPTDQCHTIDGMWSTELSNGSASASRGNDVDLSRCGAACPSGTLTHHFLFGASLTVTFDGTNVATWSTSTGKMGTVNLSCP